MYCVDLARALLLDSIVQSEWLYILTEVFIPLFEREFGIYQLSLL